MRQAGVGGYTHGLPILDIALQFKSGEPCRRLNAEESGAHIRYFVAQDKISLIYADGFQGVRKAVEDMQIPFQASEPGAPQSNAIAESNVEDYIKGARATCHHAGLP
eukprot:10665440-Karenia_brevis.AAC.1